MNTPTHEKTRNRTQNNTKILYKELSYIIQGCCFDIRKEYGPGQKESVYVNLLKECLESKGISVEKEKSIKIYSSKSSKVVGTYRPDLVIENKIPIEIKSSRITTKRDERQLYHYLRNSKYELGYLVNFSTPRLFMKRIIYSNYKKPFLKVLSCVFVFCFAWFSAAEAAILYFEPSQAEYHQGDIFIVEARLNTEGEYINTVKADLKFSQDILEVKDLSKGNSILTLWVKEPNFSVVSCGEANVSCSLVSFIGGVPAGYQGWDGLLARIVIRARETDAKLERETDAKIEFLDSCQVLLNDGFGTPAKLETKGAILTISPEKPEVQRDEWLQELEKDNISPESFEIEIHQDPSIFEGKYFIIFSTTDKQTGVDYFEVKEGEKDWQRAVSPYLLEDQNLQNIIKVKAIDKAGNERTVLIGPPRPPEKIIWKDILPWIILGLIIGGVIWLWRKYTKK